MTTSDGKMWFAEIPSYSPGFSVGVIGNLYVNPYLNLRFTPTVHFGDKKFTFIDARASDSHATFTTSIRSNYLTLPLDLKYTAMRLNNYRPYLLGGVYTSFDMGRKKETPVLLKPLDYGVEIGFECDIYLPYFKLCPELKFCFGLADVLEKDRNDLISEPDRVYTASSMSIVLRLLCLFFLNNFTNLLLPLSSAISTPGQRLSFTCAAYSS